MDDTAERLVRVETKLDSLITLNDTRISHAERKIEEVERGAAERSRHDRANTDQKLMALKADVDRRATIESVTAINVRLEKTDGWLVWLGRSTIGPILAAILALVIVKTQAPVSHQGQPSPASISAPR